ncbi:beta-aspartyl-peptidase [Anaerobacillus isosaccharinicus]|uniref:Isoaspartyl dipeptidase n=1 Tax=Anaerobacillus isosaccharinicus TaxID=1532552 RepID=A0A1S2LIW3_9BACI|nr:beta-aspartyl-peptidase [Anaerobacillus isosaccharinicus]MBA5586141.1 beta-aspartyl-peptidase [Anaerobacillus isosaccharinicus]QOY35592.1 beta-aspartyl-peptidase [Anaerobacillus isosaccharinicus]
MIKLIKNGEVYAPEYLGKQSLLIIDNKIAKMGEINESIHTIGIDVEVIDAEGCIVMPGIIDPHVHLIGGGGEGGFATRTPEILLSDIVRSGITTVVGCLGTDGTTRHMTSLLAKARGLEEEGISTYIYTGNYHVPTPTITCCVKDDIIIVDKVIGAGEIAISDSRSAQPSVHEIAKLVAEARIGGLLSGKAGVTHFHIGPGKQRLQFLHQIMEDYEIPASKIYCTHITRSKELMDDAITLANKGAFVDMTADHETGEWFAYYKKNGGDMQQLTFSSDGNGSLPVFDENGKLMGIGVASTFTLYEQFVATVREQGFPLEEVIPIVTSNTATALHLKHKGRLEQGKDGDVLVLSKEDLTIKHVLAKGKQMVKNGEVIVKGTFE